MTIQNKIKILDEKIEQGEKRKKQLTSLLEKTTNDAQRNILEQEIEVASKRLRSRKTSRTQLMRKYSIQPHQVDANIKYYAVVFTAPGEHQIFGPFDTHGEANNYRKNRLLSQQKKLNPVKRKRSVNE